MAEVNKEESTEPNKAAFQQYHASLAKSFQGNAAVKTLLDNLTEGILIVDETGAIVYINKRIEDLFGYTRSDVLGRTIEMFLPKRFYNAHEGYVGAYFKNPRQRPMGLGLDLKGRHKNGIELSLEISLSFLEIEEDKLVVALVTDITQRKKMEQALRERNKELDAFAHTVAHDLNASMSLVVGYSDTLASIHQTLPPDELQHYLTLIARNGHKMSNIINELLLFASMRREDIPFKPLNMSAIVTEALRRLNYEIEAVDAEINQQKSYPVSVGHAPWVEEVWFNYISNALKYGGNPPRLELGSDIQDDGTICFWVQDNGAGLLPNQRESVFNPLSHTGILRVKGHGLGLSIVRRIVEKLNGRVFVESQPGVGSRFGFILAAAETIDE